MSVNSYFSKKISYVRAFSWIIGSALLFSVPGFKVIEYTLVQKRKTNHKRIVSYIVQTGPQKEALLSDYLAQLLNLSADRPVSFSSLDCKESERKLLKSPVISEALVRKIKPNMIYIDYTVKKPAVKAGDFVNAAFDREGALIPVHPFFSPKKMTEIYLGESGLRESFPVAYGSKIRGYHIDLAFSVLDLLSEKGKDLFFVKRIDVAEAESPGLGRREIVVWIENELYSNGVDIPNVSSHFLRLTPKRYTEEICNYLKLREHLLEAEKQEQDSHSKILKDKVIDLRLPQLAFIDSGL